MTDRRPIVYGASKLMHSGMWLALRDECPEVVWSARWPDLTGRVSDSPENAAMFWLHDVADVKRADALILFAAEGHHLRGALVEAGVALALGKPVYVIGEHPDYGTWQFHPLVFRMPTVDAALKHIIGEWQ